MQPRDWKQHIEDILEATAKIQRYTEGMTLESFAADERTLDAVIRNLTVIGEAARHVPAEVQARYPQVPWAEMRGMREVVVHRYFGVSLFILWQTVEENLPPLVPMLTAI